MPAKVWKNGTHDDGANRSNGGCFTARLTPHEFLKQSLGQRHRSALIRALWQCLLQLLHTFVIDSVSWVSSFWSFVSFFKCSSPATVALVQRRSSDCKLVAKAKRVQDDAN